MAEKQRSPQTQESQPGLQSKMMPQPKSEDSTRRGGGKLHGKVALITGGDSGIGRAVAVAFAKEGADVGIVRCCEDSVKQTVAELNRLDILVNNAAEQHPQESNEGITAEQLERTFRTNIFSFFYMTKAALPHLHEGSA